MKRKNRKLRKALLMTCCALALVAISVGATIAYLTDAHSVTNTFTVGQVGISLDEAKTNELGEAIGNERVTGNQYRLIPGHTYIKDPTVHMDAKSESAYVRMLVTVYGYNDLLQICSHKNYSDVVGNVVLIQNFVSDWDPKVWVYEGVNLSSDDYPTSATYEFRYYMPTEKKEGAYSLDPLFKTITVPDYMNNLDLEVLDSMKKGFNGDLEPTDMPGTRFAIEVTAEAIQADGFEDADEAWAAFDAQKNGF